MLIVVNTLWSSSGSLTSTPVCLAEPVMRGSHRVVSSHLEVGVQSSTIPRSSHTLAGTGPEGAIHPEERAEAYFKSRASRSWRSWRSSVGDGIFGSRPRKVSTSSEATATPDTHL